MKGAGALASAILVLAAICTVPAVSAAQDSGSPAETTTTTTAPDPSVPADPAPPPIEPAKEGGKPVGDQPAPQDQAATTQENAAEPPVTVSDARSPGRAHASASATVTMGDFFFSPASVTVAIGDIVTWRNKGHTPHTATADDGSFDTGTVVAGQSASHMFTKPGTFSYICTIHPNMKGTVRVLSSGSGGSGGGSAGSSSSGSAQSEAAAVASPNAAGNSTTLPMTGVAAGALALVGLALLASGLIVRYSSRKTAAASVGRQLSLF